MEEQKRKVVETSKVVKPEQKVSRDTSKTYERKVKLNTDFNTALKVLTKK